MPSNRPLPPRSSNISFRDEESAPRKDGSLFVWTIIILLLIGFALGCWIFSFYVFGHPEKAFSYSLLSKLKKMEPLKRFELTGAPRGEFLSANQLNERYGKMTNRELERASEVLMRNYLRNYKLTKDLVPYMIGSYNILDSYELTDKNVFPSGVVALAQSTNNPQVLVEHVFTADQRDVQTLQRMLLTGLDLKLDRSVDLSAVVNVKRLADGRMQFTAVPILYGSYASSTGPGTFSLEPPITLHLDGGLPILDEKGVAEAGQKYSAYRLRAGLTNKTTAVNGEPPAQRPQASLVRVERPKLADGTELPSPTPAPAVATTAPAPTPEPQVRLAQPATAGVEIAPSPNTETPNLQPFLTPPPSAESIAATSSGNWPTYEPGQMPRGRLVNPPDMNDLADKGLAGERVYLQGDFVVTAASPTRAVLRSNNSGGEVTINGKSTGMRVIVQFPSSSRPPTEGSTLSRDSRRPFLITDVKKGADGQVNVFVREITRP